jgi:DNA-binding CsgD family transcriptional regulator/PAS domain-containing protein
MVERELSDVLMNLYVCPTNRSHWPVVLDQVRRTVGARCAAIQLLASGHDRANVKWAAKDSAAAADPAHDDVFISGNRNPRLRSHTGLRLRGSKMFLRDRDLFEKGNRELAELHKRLADIGLGAFMSSGIRMPDDSVLVLALHRDVNDGEDFGPVEEAFLAEVMPHLRQAIILSDRLDRIERDVSGLQQAANHIRCGLVLCDADARISWCNSAARQILARRDRIWARDGRLTAASQQATSDLRSLIAEASSGEGDAKRISRQYLLLGSPSGRMSLQVLAVPLDHTADPRACAHSPGTGHGQVMLLLGDPSMSPLLPTEVIAHLFGLSPTESRLTAAMCRGLTVNEYAASQGVSVGTARYQLKQIFAKTQTTRQADLVMRVCMSVAGQAIGC